MEAGEEDIAASVSRECVFFLAVSLDVFAPDILGLGIAELCISLTWRTWLWVSPCGQALAACIVETRSSLHIMFHALSLLTPPPPNRHPEMKDGLTLKTFFSFPSPVNSAESRLHACLATFLVPAACFFAAKGVPWLWAFIAYGFAARVACGPRLDPSVRAWLLRQVFRKCRSRRG